MLIVTWFARTIHISNTTGAASSALSTARLSGTPPDRFVKCYVIDFLLYLKLVIILVCGLKTFRVGKSTGSSFEEPRWRFSSQPEVTAITLTRW